MQFIFFCENNHAWTQSFPKMAIDQCCCCFDLEFGFFTFSIISLIGRACLASVLYFPQFVLTDADFSILIILARGLLGWMLATIAIQTVSVVGIVQKRSVLLHPFIVVLIVEPLTLLIVSTVLSFVLTGWSILLFLIFGPIEIYCAMCLINLYKVYLRQEENHQPLITSETI